MLTFPFFRAGAALALVGLLSTACAHAGGVDTVRIERPDVPVVPTPEPPPEMEHPLTGEIFVGEQDWQRRRALAVKVGNSTPERPQSGLETADIVYEELVEGGLTRFAAVYHSRGAGSIGPVRSARFVDPELISPLSPLFGYSGAIPAVVSAVRSVGAITDVNYDRVTGAYRRVGERRAPYNLYTSSSGLWARQAGDPPPQFFSWLQPGERTDPDGGEPGATVTMSFSKMTAVRYVFDTDSGTYRRFMGSAPHLTEEGIQLSPANVIVQMVPVRPAGEGLSIQVIGEGEAVLLRGGRAFRGRWHRSGNEPTRFVDAEGQSLLLARGQTHIALVPAGAGVSVG